MSDQIDCPSCQSDKVKRNGHIHNGKQNYQCKSCGRQFVVHPNKKYISQEEREMIDRLLLERIPAGHRSLAGICRVMKVSQTWLLDYVSKLYETLPDDLNAEQSPPSIREYLDDNFDKLIYELAPLKKTLCQVSLQTHGRILPLIQQMK
jgi:DNA-directed RNA polymerase subunit RPC12/RpoP